MVWKIAFPNSQSGVDIFIKKRKRSHIPQLTTSCKWNQVIWLSSHASCHNIYFRAFWNIWQISKLYDLTPLEVWREKQLLSVQRIKGFYKSVDLGYFCEMKHKASGKREAATWHFACAICQLLLFYALIDYIRALKNQLPILIVESILHVSTKGFNFEKVSQAWQSPLSC